MRHADRRSDGANTTMSPTSGRPARTRQLLLRRCRRWFPRQGLDDRQRLVVHRRNQNSRSRCTVSDPPEQPDATTPTESPAGYLTRGNRWRRLCDDQPTTPLGTVALHGQGVMIAVRLDADAGPRLLRRRSPRRRTSLCPSRSDRAWHRSRSRRVRGRASGASEQTLDRPVGDAEAIGDLVEAPIVQLPPRQHRSLPRRE